MERFLENLYLLFIVGLSFKELKDPVMRKSFSRENKKRSAKLTRFLCP